MAASPRVPSTHGPSDNRSGREGKPSQLLTCETCCPVHVLHREDASLHPGLDLIWAHKENPRHLPKSQDHSRKQEPSFRLLRQISVLSTQTWLSKEFWGRDAKPGLGPLLQAG